MTVPAGDRIITSDCVAVVPAGPLRRAIRVPVRAGAKHYVTLDACMLAEGTETTAASLIAETKPVRQG